MKLKEVEIAGKELAEGVVSAALCVKHPTSGLHRNIDTETFGYDEESIVEPIEQYLIGHHFLSTAKFITGKIVAELKDHPDRIVFNIDAVCTTGRYNEPHVRGWECVGGTDYYPALMQVMYPSSATNDRHMKLGVVASRINETEDAVWLLDLNYLGKQYLCWMRSAVCFESYQLALHIQAVRASDQSE